ncbi:MAG: hypothetical protein DRJ28_03525 [Actinobacteria bacterium]|nr:MAG: hypothetical protein DRJ28_03525 [Actinomycetota bacterium]
MTEAVDEDSAHRYFAAEFFNTTWNMLKTETRSREDIARGAETGAFYVGYGHEAVARAASALGDPETANLHIEAARSILSSISDPDERHALRSDSDEIGSSC